MASRRYSKAGTDAEAHGADPRPPGSRWAPLIAATVAAVTAVTLAFVSWFGRDAMPTGTAPETGELHLLNVDQAACLRFAIIIRRSEAHEVTLDLGRYQTLDPHAGKRVAEEVAALDELGPDYPEADYRLIRTFATTADEGARVLAGNGSLTFRDAAAGRSQAIAESGFACDGIASFDVETLEVG